MPGSDDENYLEQHLAEVFGDGARDPNSQSWLGGPTN